MDAIMNKEINAILGKEINDIFKELAIKIEPRIKEHKFLPWLLAYKMEVDSARIILALPDSHWTPLMGEFKCSEEFAAKLGLDKSYVEDQLDERYYSGELQWNNEGGSCTKESGLWHDLQNSKRWIEKNGKAYYKIISMFVEQEIVSIDQEKMNKMKERGQMGFARIIPRYDSVKDYEGLLPVENIKEILRNAEVVSSNGCACRITYPELNLTDKVCISLNSIAKFADKIEIGKIEPWEKVFDELQKAGKKTPHCHMNKHTDNMDEIGGVLCSCTVDACIILKATADGRTNLRFSECYGKSRFLAVIDAEKCINCGLCAKKRCMFDAIILQYNRDILEEKHFVLSEACMGCGCCVETCPTKAITMECVQPPEFLKGYKLDKNENVKDQKLEKYWGELKSE